MDDLYWSWILGLVGLIGFILAGRKIWWSWYVNIACQGLWFTYAIVTEQYGFLVAAVAYTVVFTKNAIVWTREHRETTEKYRYIRKDLDTDRRFIHAPQDPIAYSYPNEDKYGVTYTHGSHVMMPRQTRSGGIVYICILCGNCTCHQTEKLKYQCGKRFIPDSHASN